MKRKSILLVLVVGLLTIGALATVNRSRAQTSASYGLEWYVLSGGLGEMSSASYRLNSTVGQTMAGEFSGTNYNLYAGYWQIFLRRVYLPLVLRNYE